MCLSLNTCIFLCPTVCSSSFSLLFLPLPIYSLSILHLSSVLQPFYSCLLFSPPCFSFHQFASSQSLPLDILPSLSITISLPPLHPPFSHCLFHLLFFPSSVAHLPLFPFTNPFSLSIQHTLPSLSTFLTVCEREERVVCLTAAPLGVCVRSGV